MDESVRGTTNEAYQPRVAAQVNPELHSGPTEQGPKVDKQSEPALSSLDGATNSYDSLPLSLYRAENGHDYVVDHFKLKGVTELRPDTIKHIGEHVEREMSQKGILPTVGGAKEYLDGLTKKLRITGFSDPYFVTNVLYSYFTNPRGARSGVPTRTVEMLSKHIEWLQGLLDRTHDGSKKEV